MDITAVKNFLGACHEAKRITELMPELPKGMTPRHIQVLDVIWQMEAAGQSVKVSDISDFLNVTRPSITKLIRELEGFGAVVKLQDGEDRRVVRISLTDLGRQYYGFYVEKYQNWLAERFSDIDQEDLETAARTISRVYKIMRTSRMEEISE